MKGLSIDAAGTLLALREPVHLTYARAAGADPDEVRRRLAGAFASWTGPRQIGDGRPFWSHVVSQSTGNADPQVFEHLYAYYGRAHAWNLAPGAFGAIDRAHQRGMRVAVASNWDLRLRPLLAELGVLDRVEAAVISGEIGVEKPDTRFFAAVSDALGCEPAQVLHVGDDPRADVDGARAAGMSALRHGVDVQGFDDLLR